MTSKNLGFGRGTGAQFATHSMRGGGHGSGRASPTPAPSAKRQKSNGGKQRNGAKKEGETRSGWVCVSIGNTNLGPKEAEFCVKLAEEGNKFGFEIDKPVTNRSGNSIEAALNTIGELIANERTKNALACLVISDGKFPEKDLRYQLIQAHQQHYRFFTLNLEQVEDCLTDSTILSKTAKQFCLTCRFNKSSVQPEPRANAAADRPKLKTVQRSNSVWISLSIGGLDRVDVLKEFCGHFSRVVRSKSYNLADCVAQKQVSSTEEAIVYLKSLPDHPETQEVGACMAICGGNMKQMKTDLTKAVGRKLRICIFREFELRRALNEDAAMAVLADKFTSFCDIPRKVAFDANDAAALDAMMGPSSSRSVTPAYPMGEVRLRELCDKLQSGALATSSSELIQKLTTDGSFYERIRALSSQQYPKKLLLEQIMKLVAAAGKYNQIQFKEIVNELLNELLKAPDFLSKASELCIASLEDRRFESTPLRELQMLQSVVKDHLSVLCLLLDRFPSSYSSVRVAVSSARLILKQENIQSPPFLNPEINDLLERIEIQWKFALSRNQQPEADKSKARDDTFVDESGEPPDDFRLIGICPSKEDIIDAPKPFLRRNITKGAYEDSEHYLDVQFRLLREDFIGPLREGIKQYLDGQRRRTGLYVYKNVVIQPPKIDKRSGIMTYPVYFAPMRYARWVKRLKYGSLVCLSSDNFQNNLLFATVTDHTVELLQKGEVSLNFEFLDQPGASRISYKETYTMVEPNVYFQAYRHVLKGLQAIPKNEPVPFERYLVFCTSDVGRPAYLDQHPNVPVKFDSLTGKPTQVLNVFNDEYWPSKEELNLDESQFDALKLGLTSELAIIQGPPGTGKTFIGHQLTKLFLANDELWNPEQQHPILVVCYTNHALDQFLEGIIEFADCDDIVRIGGQCKNETLQKYCLHVIRQRKRDLVEGELRFRIRNTRSEQFQLQRQINHIGAIFMKLQSGDLPNMGVVRSTMSPNHQQALPDDNLLYKWLVTPPDYNVSESKAKQRINLPLVRQLTEIHLPEIVVKRALHMTGNTDANAAYTFVLQYWGNPQLGIHDEVTVRWPQLADVDTIVALGFPEEDAVLALENQKDVQKAIDLLTKAFGTQQAEQNENVPVGNQIEEVIEPDDDVAAADEDLFEEEENDNVNDFRILEEDFLASFGNVDSFFDRNAENQIGHFFFPRVDISQVENLNQLSRLDRLRPMIAAEQPLTQAGVALLGDIWKEPLKVRWSLYNHWMNLFKQRQLEMLKRLEQQYGELSKSMRNLITMSDLKLLRSTKVIGMTTSGAAQNQSLLRSIEPRIVIMEEAAEVLESHLVTSLSSGCEHVILIGDHQQLRPSLSVYELAKHYKLDVSLFERLINNNFKHAMLKMQHRMRPEISRTLMPHFYPELLDHESVLNYEDVRGMETNMLFLNHSCPETEDSDSKSHYNNFEAQMTVALSKYLLKQDYNPEQITVLCTYLDQMIHIKKQMKSEDVQGVRVTVVDNYQGEESDIIILSLVRSNNQGKIGFLKVKNRVCVAMSRAKIGFYCLGNFEHLAGASTGRDMENVLSWQALVDDLRAAGFLQTAIPIVCQMHGEKQVIQQVSDFVKLSPEGGCRQLCNTRLEKCGHVCDKPCHAYDLDHETIPCSKPCARDCPQPEKHRCKKICHQECGDCQIMVQKKLPCGHNQEIQCYIDVTEADCKEACPELLLCGHACKNLCCQPCTERCTTKVKKRLPCDHVIDANCHLQASEVKCSKEVLKFWPHCEHQVLVQCHVDPKTTPCPYPCSQPLPGCDHPCQGTCGQCRRGRLHIRCDADCKRIMICGHPCKNKCSRFCPPCDRPCETQCCHSKCGAVQKSKKKKGPKRKGRRCGDMCPLCAENCGWSCEHEGCYLRCYEPCKRQPCVEPCFKELPCSTDEQVHMCIGVCGEPCPKVCRVCNPERMEELTQIFFGDEDDPEARFIQLEDCGHILEMKGIDTWIRTQTEPKADDTSGAAQAIEVLSCPRCKQPIRQSMRFGKYLKQRMLDIEQVKLKVLGSTVDQLDSARAELISEVNDMKSSLLSGSDAGRSEALREAIQHMGLEELRRYGFGADREILTAKMIEKYSGFLYQLEKTISKPDKKDLTQDKLDAWRNIMRFLVKLRDFEQRELNRFLVAFNKPTNKRTMEVNLSKMAQLSAISSDFFGGSLGDFLVNEHGSLLDWLLTHHNNMSDAMMRQFACEIQRLTLIAQICVVVFGALSSPVVPLNSAHYDRMRTMLSDLNGTKTIDQTIEDECQAVIDDWKKLVTVVPGTGITPQERTEITQAMRLTSGHWYKCPNGHIYAIDDCGGAAVASRCPECRATIGGRDHLLHEGNTRADDVMLGRNFY